MGEILQRESAYNKLFLHIHGYKVTQALEVVVSLGIADLLKDGPRNVKELAVATETDSAMLYRLLRFLASMGTFHEVTGQIFSLNESAEFLCTDGPDSVASFITFVARADILRAWGELQHTVRTGEASYPRLFGETFFDRNAKKEDGESFDKAMDSRGLRRDEVALAGAYDFGKFSTIMDVGGGYGSFLLQILRRYPNTEGILFDLPLPADCARRAVDTTELRDRCRVVAGDFFDSIPRGADAYIFKLVIHDWDDNKVALMLRKCREVIPDGGRLLIIGPDLGRPNADPGAKIMDLHMAVILGGMERSVAEHEELFLASGFRLGKVVPVPQPSIDMVIIEGIPS